MVEKREDEDGGNGNDVNPDQLLARLEVIGNGGWFLWKIFLLCTLPSILNGLHLTSYVYLAEVPEYWCRVTELSGSNWTTDEIRRISSPRGSNESSCEYYDRDYVALAKMNFSEALEWTRSQKEPDLLPCRSYEYSEGLSSMVIDYNLVCDRTALKSMIQVSLSIGKFVGALLFGVLSDKFGRRLSFLLGCLLYIISGPLVAFAMDYTMITAGRIGLGAASSGIYQSAFVLLSEIASKRRRAILGILYNMSYPIGQMIVPLMAYFCRDWRLLQTIISVPSIVILGFYWLLPESPRWLILKGRQDEAARIIEEVHCNKLKTREESAVDKETVAMTETEEQEDEEEEGISGQGKDGNSLDKEEKVLNLIESKTGSEKHNIWKKLCSTLNQIMELLKYFELRSRLLIILSSWCVCSLSYYALALNVDNFLTDRYLYGFITGLVEVPSYILPLPLLRYFGRRHTSILLFYVGGFALLTILAIPRHEDLLLLIVASAGRLCASAVFAVVILHTTELFPTLLRNTAIGCCSTAAHVGSMSAPFIVDLLGAYAWFIPSTVCGIVTILAGTMIFLLPETKNKPLPDTVNDIITAPKHDKMGFHQVCR